MVILIDKMTLFRGLIKINFPTIFKIFSQNQLILIAKSQNQLIIIVKIKNQLIAIVQLIDTMPKSSIRLKKHLLMFQLAKNSKIPEITIDFEEQNKLQSSW